MKRREKTRNERTITNIRNFERDPTVVGSKRITVIIKILYFVENIINTFYFADTPEIFDAKRDIRKCEKR